MAMTMRETGPNDPKGLIFEAYQIEGITREECRSIFLDWALSLGEGQVPHDVIAALLHRYGDATHHPMTETLREGLAQIERPRRRGGWRSRTRPGGSGDA